MENQADKPKYFDCDQCEGYGSIVVPEHHPSCDGMCKGNCPVPVQVPCDKCGGTGRYSIGDEE